MTQNQDVTRARLKWFNNPKGFGFVVPEAGPAHECNDAFLHITTLQKAGISAMGEGACLLCQIDRGPRGAQVSAILEVIDSGVAPQPLTILEHHRDIRQESCLQGIVKWYKPDKGFGFIVADDGLKDVFIHKTCLDKRGIQDLKPGQRLTMTIRSVPKGREVIDFELLDS